MLTKLKPRPHLLCCIELVVIELVGPCILLGVQYHAARAVHTVAFLQSYLGLLLFNEVMCGERVTLCHHLPTLSSFAGKHLHIAIVSLHRQIVQLDLLTVP